MRVVVISLDALDPTLVDKYNCNILKQKYHGTVDLEPHFITRPEGVGSRNPSTPHIYSIFFTGILPTKSMGYNRYNDFILEINQNKHDIIFNHAKEPFGVDMPVLGTISKYGAGSWMNRITGEPLFGGYFRDIFTLEEAERAYYSYMDCKTELIQILDKLHYDFIFVYYKESDTLQHMYGHYDTTSDDADYKGLYKKCEEYTKRYIDTFDDGNTLIMVLSDHGVNMKGGHSRYGFWSSNMDIGYSDSLPVNEVFDVMKTFLYKERIFKEGEEHLITDEGKRILAERLRNLGYVV